tara:strand:+ start:2013 stop:2237 length:225 start_codon:yes stop_codon:yes gene_type:complete
VTKIKVELEGEAYADVLTAMNDFTHEILERISEIESLLDKITSLTGANADTLDTLKDAMGRLEKAKEALEVEDD